MTVHVLIRNTIYPVILKDANFGIMLVNHELIIHPWKTVVLKEAQLGGNKLNYKILLYLFFASFKYLENYWVHVNLQNVH